MENSLLIMPKNMQLFCIIQAYIKLPHFGSLINNFLICFK